jgi:hypothetical protein
MAFCEGDDWWHRRDKLKIQIPFFRADNSLVCLSGEIQRISAEGQVIEPEKQSNGAQQPIRIEYQDIIFQLSLQYPCTTVARTDAVRRALLGDTLCSDHSQLMADMALFYELSQLGGMMHLRETLARYRSTPNSASSPTDPLRRLRFGISCLDIRYRALERYPLPGDASRTARLKANFIWRIILMAAWLGDVAVARNQLRRLRGLGAKVGWKEIALVVLAFIPLPRRSLKAVYVKIAPHLERMGLNPRKHLKGEDLAPPLRHRVGR